MKTWIAGKWRSTRSSAGKSLDNVLTKAEALRAKRRHAPGLDAPIVDPSHDVLNRHRIAREIYRLIKSQARDQSVRIGVFGEWGYGKTTIANWVSELAEKDGEIVVWFNPWSARDISELWVGLAIALNDALAAHGVKLSSGARLKSLAGDLNKNYGSAASSAAGPRISGVAAAFLRFDKKDIEAMATQLGDRKVVVCIDDIDRADPVLLPQLLLSLREILDVPRFAFVVPFEKRIVSEALVKHHPAWVSGERFLEKILDFQVPIPATTEEERWVLFSSIVREILGDDGTKVLAAYKQELPDNPRRIKRLGRMLELYGGEIDRHRSDEIDWPSLLFGSLIQLESEEFFRRYVAQTFFSTDERIAEGIIDDPAKRVAARDERVEKILTESRITDQDQSKRLKALASRWETERSYWYSSRISYTLRMFDRPDSFTWQEIDELLDKWVQPAGLEAAQEVVSTKVREMGRPQKDIVKELLDTLGKKYQQLLEQAASAFSAKEQGDAVSKAKNVLARIEVLAFDKALAPPELRAAVFSIVMGSLHTWGHFKANASDADIRKTEADLADRLVSEAGDAWQLYMPNLTQDRFGERRSEYNAITSRLSKSFEGMAAKRALDALERQNGVYELLKDGTEAAAQAILVDPNSSIWLGAAATAPAMLVFGKAATSPAIQQNARAVIEIARGAAGTELSVDREDVRALVKRGEFAVVLWNALIAAPIQYRMLQDTRILRKFLIANGVDEKQLVMPDWLHQGEENDSTAQGV